MRKILISLLVIPFSVIAFGQENDSVVINSEFLNTDSNLDSLVSTRFSQDPVTEDSPFVSEIDSSQKQNDLPDSVYINRLRNIPSIFELTYNDIVKRYIQVYTVKKRGIVEEMLGLKDYYFPLFEEILDRNQMPLELKYLSVIESALNPRAVSRCGATGLWQFMYGTGRLYKLTINSYVDDRRDPVASTNAAAKYLRDLYSVYNNWTLALAAYNCGPGNVNKAIRRAGGKTSYWDIYYFLPRETRGYVPAFIAATYVMNYYKEHNLTARSATFALPESVDTIMLANNVHLQQVADVLQVPIEQIRDLNPQYRRDIIPGKYSPCPLRLPSQWATRFIDLQDSVYRYKNDKFFSGEFKIIIPANYRSGRGGRQGRMDSYGPPPPSGDMQRIYHQVKSGENLGQIASLYRVRVSDIRYWNDISKNKIIAGKRLVIYLPKKKTAKLQTSQGAEAKPSAMNTKEIVKASDFVYYEIKSGDTLWKIASQYPGISDNDLMKWNNLDGESKIKPGQTLKIKRIN